MLVLLFCAAGAVRAETPAHAPRIAIVLSEEVGPYAEFGNALIEALAGSGVDAVLIGPTGAIPDAGLAVGVGMKAATAVAATHIPFALDVLVPKAAYENLLRDSAHRAGPHTVSVIYLDQPVARQVRLVRAAFPDRKNVGLLYAAAPEELAQLRQEMAGQGLRLHEQAIGARVTLAEALEHVLQGSEVLFAVPDAAVYNGSTIRNILLSTYRRGVPLVGFSAGYVRAGALCAVFSTPQQIAAQAAALIRQFGEGHALPGAQYPREFEVMVNEQVAHSLGLEVKAASALHDEIAAEEGP